jgi:TatD DNase family protein
MRPLVDTHCHLGHHFDLDVATQLARARAAGVACMVDVGTDVASSRAAVANAAAQPDVWAAVGLHPNDAGTRPTRCSPRSTTSRLAAGRRGRGDGLDRYRDTATPEQQDRAFRAQIAIARRHDLAVVVHCRDAWDACVRVLEEEGMVGPDARVVLHCYSGDVATTLRTVANGWFHSFAGNVTFTNAAPLREVAALVPDELLLTETDAPYLTPHPHRGRPNDPSYVGLTLDVLAQCAQSGRRRARGDRPGQRPPRVRAPGLTGRGTSPVGTCRAPNLAACRHRPSPGRRGPPAAHRPAASDTSWPSPPSRSRWSPSRRPPRGCPA